MRSVATALVKVIKFLEGIEIHVTGSFAIILIVLVVYALVAMAYFISLSLR